MVLNTFCRARIQFVVDSYDKETCDKNLLVGQNFALTKNQQFWIIIIKSSFSKLHMSWYNWPSLEILFHWSLFWGIHLKKYFHFWITYLYPQAFHMPHGSKKMRVWQTTLHLDNNFVLDWQGYVCMKWNTMISQRSCKY